MSEDGVAVTFYGRGYADGEADGYRKGKQANRTAEEQDKAISEAYLRGFSAGQDSTFDILLDKLDSLKREFK